MIWGHFEMRQPFVIVVVQYIIVYLLMLLAIKVVAGQTAVVSAHLFVMNERELASLSIFSLLCLYINAKLDACNCGLVSVDLCNDKPVKSTRPRLAPQVEKSLATTRGQIVPADGDRPTWIATPTSCWKNDALKTTTYVVVSSSTDFLVTSLEGAWMLASRLVCTSSSASPFLIVPRVYRVKKIKDAERWWSIDETGGCRRRATRKSRPLTYLLNQQHHSNN